MCNEIMFCQIFEMSSLHTSKRESKQLQIDTESKKNNQVWQRCYEPLATIIPTSFQVRKRNGSTLVNLIIRATGKKITRLKSPRNPRNCAILAFPFISSSSGSFLRIRVMYTAYKPAETRERTSPSRGFEAVFNVISDCKSPRLTIIVPPIQRRTLASFTHVNFSPKNARETKNVKRLEPLLKIVFDYRKKKMEL